MTLPPGSNIKIETDQSGFTRLIIPHSQRPLLTYAGFAFVIFETCVWAVGLVWVMIMFRDIFARADSSKILLVAIFAIIWLSIWIFFGVGCIAALYRLCRAPETPEVITFGRPALLYDSGIRPFILSLNSANGQMEMWKRLFERREKYEFESAEISSLCLRDTETGNRLTIDKVNKRINIGGCLSEVEREWLYKALKEEYKN
jgi:hypothetical protein